MTILTFVKLILNFYIHIYIFFIRRLFAWLLGTEVNTSILKKHTERVTFENNSSAYFELYSKNLLIESIKATLKATFEENQSDLRPYRIMVSLLDKPDIGPVILDDILYEVFRYSF